MADFKDQLKRMQDLMGCNSINENTNKSNHNIEYHAIGADGKIYGIIRENTKYYIKTTEKGKENIAESYEYIGGFCNRKDHEYSSYTNATKQLELKLMSINEAVGKHVNVEVLNPSKKEDLVIEGTEKMKEEIARQRQIMMNASAILNEESAISTKNIGVPEAPKTASFTPTIGEPFEEKAEAKLDKDLTSKASDPKKEGNPFDKEEKITDGDMESDKNPKGGKDEYKDAQYVPNGSVANQKPSGAKSVKMNEECEEWGSCGLPSDNAAGVSKDIPDIMGEDGASEIVGQEDLGDDTVLNDEDNVMSDEAFDALLADNLGEDVNMGVDKAQMYNADDRENAIEYGDDMTTFESKRNKLIDSIVESVTKKILGEARGNGVGILPSAWFKGEKVKNEDGSETIVRQFMPFANKYMKLVDTLRNMKSSNNPEEVNEMYEGSEKTYLLLKRVIKALSEGGKLNMRPEEYNSLKQSFETGRPEDVEKLLQSIDDVWAQIGSVWDDKYAKEEDEKFDSENNDWNQHKVDDLGYASDDVNDLDAIERRDRDYAMGESKLPKNGKKQTVKEETTVLHDFGKHPGYRKKPMTLPSDTDSEKNGYKDWNDDSVKGDKPFGQEIGSSAPFDEKVKMITDAVMSQLKEMYKKKR